LKIWRVICAGKNGEWIGNGIASLMSDVAYVCVLTFWNAFLEVSVIAKKTTLIGNTSCSGEISMVNVRLSSTMNSAFDGV